MKNTIHKLNEILSQYGEAPKVLEDTWDEALEKILVCVTEMNIELINAHVRENQLKDDNENLQDVLAWYADEDNYDYGDDTSGRVDTLTYIEMDKGKLAQCALKDSPKVIPPDADK